MYNFGLMLNGTGSRQHQWGIIQFAQSDRLAHIADQHTLQIRRVASECGDSTAFKQPSWVSQQAGRLLTAFQTGLAALEAHFKLGQGNYHHRPRSGQELSQTQGDVDNASLRRGTEEQMDPQGRFTNEYQALRYVRDYTDELAAAYGKADESSRKQTGWLAKQIGQLLGYLGAHLVALGERMNLDKEVPPLVQHYAHAPDTTVAEKTYVNIHSG